jgi:hypothetical protein
MNHKSKNRTSAVLGLAIDANRLEAAVVRRSGSSVQVRQSVIAPLALSPLTGDPELVGREIRNHLESAGIRENRCVVCIPLTWILSLQVKVPEMPPADVESFLQIEAERGFTSGSDSLFITRSMFKAPNGDHYATLLAVPRNHLDLLDRALKAANLKPMAFAVGISATQSPSQAAGRVLTLALTGHGLELQVTGGGGIIALRSLDAAVDAEGARRSVSADLVARELRITLGQLPGGFSEASGPIKIFGDPDTTRQFVSDIAPRLAVLNLRVEPMDRPASVTFETAPKGEISTSSALALAAAYVSNTDIGPDLLPPKVSPWKQFVTTKLGTQKLAYAGMAAALVVLIVGGLFGWQQIQLFQLRSQWNAMAAEVNTLDDDMAKLQKYHPWFDDSYPALTVLAKLTSAFPDEGSITAKSIEVRDLTTVTVHGSAKTQAVFNATREKLGSIPGCVNVKGDTTGTAPQMQYNLAFDWNPNL